MFHQRNTEASLDSDACINEIRALSKMRIKEKITILSEKALEIIQKAIYKIIL